MAQSIPNPQLQLNIMRAPQMPNTVILCLGSSALAMSTQEARQVAQMLLDSAQQAEIDLIVADSNTPLPPIPFNGRSN